MSGSQGERKVLIPAGGTIPVRVPGDFIFIKFADRPVIVRIGEQAITMRAGDRRRIERRANAPMAPAFDIFELENPSDVAPLAVEFVAGEGDYTSQIINGEVVIAPGIRRADGRWYDDTRRDINLRLSLSSIDAVNHSRLQEVDAMYLAMSGNGYVQAPIGDGEGRFFAIRQGNWPGIWDFENKTRESLVWWPSTGCTSPVFVRGPFGGSYYACSVRSDGNGRYLRLYRFASLTADSWAMRAIIDTEYHIGDGAGVGSDTGLFLVNGLFWMISSYVASGGVARRVLLAFDATGTVYNRVELGSGTFGTTLGVEAGVVHVGNNFTWDRAFDSRSFVEVSTTLPNRHSFGNQPPYRWAAWEYGPRHYMAYSQTSGGTTLRKVAKRDWTDYARGSVSACSGAGMFVADSVPTDAALELVRDSAGRPVASGQVIKAALDIYLGEAGGYVAPDYLDHIYGVEFEYANYMRPASIQTGGSSFARAGIADDFKNVVLPQRIKITADAGLMSESGQWNS